MIPLRLCLLLMLLLRQTAAAPSLNQARQDVEIDYVNLVFKPGCHRQSEILESWDDAIKLLKSLDKVDFDKDWAAFEFFGPPRYNGMYFISCHQVYRIRNTVVHVTESSPDFYPVHNRARIQAVLDNAKTFAQGWAGIPASWKVTINVDCSVNPKVEIHERCKRKGV